MQPSAGFFTFRPERSRERDMVSGAWFGHDYFFSLVELIFTMRDFVAAQPSANRLISGLQLPEPAGQRFRDTRGTLDCLKSIQSQHPDCREHSLRHPEWRKVVVLDLLSVAAHPPSTVPLHQITSLISNASVISRPSTLSSAGIDVWWRVCCPLWSVRIRENLPW